MTSPLTVNSIVLLASVLLSLAGCTTGHESTGPSILLPKSGCTGTPIGCWSDCLAGGSAQLRTLPIGVSGCCQTDQDPPGGCPTCPKACVNAEAKKSNPDFLTDVCPAAGHVCPTCVGSQLTGQGCADLCAEMNPEFAVAGVEYGVQCFCGTEIHAHSKLNDPTKKCDMPCGGNPAEKCGGGCALTVYEIDCGSNWGWTLLLTLCVGSVLYVGGGVAYNHKTLGQPLGVDALPHRSFWTAAHGLVVDGTVFFMENAKREIAKQRGVDYQPLPDTSVPTVDSGDGSESAPVKPNVEPVKTPGEGLVEHRDDSVHPSKAPIRVVAKPLAAQEDPDPFGKSSDDEELVE